MKRKKATDFDQKLLNLFDRYVHGLISRREFLDGASKFAVGGLSAAAILESLSPKYAEVQQVAEDDPRLKTEYIDYPSAQGSGTMRGYLARPADSHGNLPGVVVIHENRGLNPHIKDVTRRTGLAGFLAFAPDALTPLGGYPGNDDDGRVLQRQLDRGKMTEDFVAAAIHLKSHPECSGRVGVVGFCFGGGMANTLAVRIPDLVCAVAFY
ncbi:dienelactone hydrolase family protein, partial [Acidobacteria bacterium AH-259-A15]|nr:dienelactone hydrolase family protein [Acidobacteria bacterium AH-259-A15]